jgi:N-acyl-D-aspartate/D-glutamate deacylase
LRRYSNRPGFTFVMSCILRSIFMGRCWRLSFGEGAEIKIEAARARGLDVTANRYPYTAMQHQWVAFFPVWAREGGPDKFAAMLRDPAMRRRIKEDRDFRTWVMEHGGSEGIVLGRARQPEIKKYEGMRIAEIAKARGDEDPADTCLALMSEEGGAWKSADGSRVCDKIIGKAHRRA